MDRTFQKILQKRILVSDGAMGTILQKHGYHSSSDSLDFLCLKNKKLIEKIHLDYLESGADIISTNSFGANALDLKSYRLEKKVFEINYAAASIAKEQAKKFKNRFVAGSIGPGHSLLSLKKHDSFQKLVNVYKEQAKGLYRGGVDFFLLETFTDLLNIKAALFAIEEFKIPKALSVSLDRTLLSGQDIMSLIVSLSHQDFLYLGINCQSPSHNLKKNIELLKKYSPFKTYLSPNAGLPDKQGNYPLNSKSFLQKIKNLLKKNQINIIGGCCGTTPEHIYELKTYINTLDHRLGLKRNTSKKSNTFVTQSLLSQISYLNIKQEKKPIIVGEKANAIGSRAFKDALSKKDYPLVKDIILKQVFSGAKIIDLCLSYPNGDEVFHMNQVLTELSSDLKVPLMLDTMDYDVLEMALPQIAGKCIINSLNLEKGEKAFVKKANLAKKYGAAIVVGLIDEKTQAKTLSQKLSLAKRMINLLKDFPPQDIYFDPLVFSCISFDKSYKNSAQRTLDAIRKLKKTFKQSKTIIGLSNLSFGLPSNGRALVNSYFLYHAKKVGLDLVIANTEKLLPYNKISKKERNLCHNLLLHQNTEILSDFKDYCAQLENEEVKRKNNKIQNHLTTLRQKNSIEEKVQDLILTGNKENLKSYIDELLKKHGPNLILKNILMPSMDKVGVLFNKGRLIISEVLRSTEVMSQSLKMLAEHLSYDRLDSKQKVMILATVKGDVHDIGKNLVDMIFSNNNFKVINLGVRVESKKIISAIKKYNADFIGLSSLLVESSFEMKKTALDLKKAGIHLPLLCGGASISEEFVKESIRKVYENSYYAGDVMHALMLIKSLFDKR